jgi:CHAT domain-containing protein
MMKKAMEVEDRLIRRTFATSPERDRLAYLESIRYNFEILLSLVRNKLWDSPAAVATALDLVLKRKSLTASASAAFNNALYSGRYPHLQADFQRWRQLNEGIVQLTFSPPELKPEMTREQFRQEQLNHRQRLTELEAESEKLERWLASQVPEIQLQEQESDRRAVALELPEGSALLEFVRFRVYDFDAPKGKEWQPARYLAFVLPAGQPEGVRAVDLGDAEHIDRLIATFRQAASKPTSNLGGRKKKTDKPSKSVGVELGQAIFTEELRQAVEGCQHLLFAPDGNLNLIPFQVLPINNEEKERLIDKYDISYLSAGRELLRRKLGSTRPADPPLILADPDYNWGLEEVPEAAGPGTSELGKGNLPATLAGESWFPPALGTDYLGETAGKILGVKPHLQRDAAESRLTGGNCPRVLLVATHGEFAEENKEYFKLIDKLMQCRPEEKRKILENNSALVDRELAEIMEALATWDINNGCETKANRLQNMAKQVEEMLAPTPTTAMLGDRRPAAKLKNPMLRSAIALAAANTWLSGRPLPEGAGKKGVVHALDIAALDLWGCELAVLSACQTGLGDIRMGEGVFGMRRAFAIAGAQTLIMSLWSVPARATALLMERFFHNLRQGVGRGDALQAAQNYLRTVTVEELAKTELGKDVLEELESNPVLKQLLAEPQPLAHPYFWGAWVCQGDTRGLEL